MNVLDHFDRLSKHDLNGVLVVGLTEQPPPDKFVQVELGLQAVLLTVRDVDVKSIEKKDHVILQYSGHVGCVTLQAKRNVALAGMVSGHPGWGAAKEFFKLVNLVVFNAVGICVFAIIHLAVVNIWVKLHLAYCYLQIKSDFTLS